MTKEREFYLFEQGEKYFSEKKLSLSLKHFNELIEINPQHVDGHYKLASIYYQQGKISLAIKFFRKVLELDENYTDAAISLSVLLNDIGQYDEAKKVFEVQSLKIKRSEEGGIIDPHINRKFGFKHFELGDLYFGYDRYDEALFEYEKSLRLNPDSPDSIVQIAKVYAKKGHVTKALELLRKAKVEHPNHLSIRVSLGILLFGNGNVIEAEEEWSKVVEKDPKNSDALMYLKLAQTATETSIKI